MTQLEKKLKEMGYKHIFSSYSIAVCETIKYYIKDTNQYIETCYGNINDYYVQTLNVKTQEDIDNIQIAFNNLKRDIEEIKNEL